ncbi:MAG: flippase-like domain-containing protein [candidate division Zixibacteria bacterium]|nr:flippase-like domain-containing protein [candidate division Zixibacteria bacterium]
MEYKRYIPVLVGIVLLVVCFYDYDLNRVREIFSSVNYYILIPAFIFELVNLFVRSQRLKIILNPIKKISDRSIFSYYSIGTFANVALPALSGQVVRMFLFARKYKISKTAFATGAMLEVLFDGLCLFGLMVGISFIVKFPEWMFGWRVGLGIAVMTLALLLVYITYRRSAVVHFTSRFTQKLPQSFNRKLARSYNSFTRALRMLKSYKDIFKVSFLSMLSWAIHGVIIYMMFRAVGFTLGPWAAYFLLVVNSLAIMIVVTPGNVGTFNLACALALSLFGINKTDAISFSILLYVVNFLPLIIAGLIFTIREGVSIMGLKDTAAPS